jgi:hypothetical protein
MKDDKKILCNKRINQESCRYFEKDFIQKKCKRLENYEFCNSAWRYSAEEEKGEPTS